MEQGWRSRRELERHVGREALRRGAGNGRAPPRAFVECRNDDERFAYIARLAWRGGPEVLEQLAEIAAACGDEVHFAARVAFAQVAGRGRKRPPRRT